MRGEKRERILRILLTQKNIPNKSEISRQASCSRQWVILFLRELKKKGLIKEKTIPDIKKLIKYWLNIKPKLKFRQYMVKEPLNILKNTKLNYALTTYSAENLLQHYLFPSRTDIYIKKQDLQKWHSLMTKNGLYGKGNVRIIIKDNHVMHKKQHIKNFYLVNTAQLIVDLYEEGGHCEEAANMLLKRL